MTATLNIGLNVGGRKALHHTDVLGVLQAMGIDVIDYNIATSDTEETVVCIIDRPLSAQEGHALAVVLRQEAIAQYSRRIGIRGGVGKSFGPQSGRWVFNPKFFIMIDGTRLADAPWPWEVEKTAISYRAKNTHTCALGPERGDFATALEDANRLTREGATMARVDYQHTTDSERQS